MISHDYYNRHYQALNGGYSPSLYQQQQNQSQNSQQMQQISSMFYAQNYRGILNNSPNQWYHQYQAPLQKRMASNSINNSCPTFLKILNL